MFYVTRTYSFTIENTTSITGPTDLGFTEFGAIGSTYQSIDAGLPLANGTVAVPAVAISPGTLITIVITSTLPSELICLCLMVTFNQLQLYYRLTISADFQFITN